MKKLFIACAIALCAGMFASCATDDGSEGCYKVTTKYTLLGISVSEDLYLWGTLDDVKTLMEASNKMFEEQGYTVKSTYKKTNKAQSDCYND